MKNRGNITLKSLLVEDNSVPRGPVKLAYLDLEVVNKMLKGTDSLDPDKLDKIKRMLIDITKNLRIAVGK